MVFFKKGNRWKLLCFMSALMILLTACGSGAEQMQNVSSQTEGAENNITLNVAIFPYVPAPQRFESAIQDEWQKIHPDVSLNFVEWDCYDSKEVPDDLDVFTFDGIYLTEYAKNGELLALDTGKLSEWPDILTFVQEGILVDKKVYGVPQMICANLFFYRPGDSEVSLVNNVGELYEVLGDNPLDQERPENGKGLLVNMSSGTGNICFYLDAILDVRAFYSDFTVMPDLKNMNEAAIDGLNRLILMAGRKQAYTATEGAYTRAEWFGEGSGRAYIGYSESMAAMGDYVSKVQVKTLSLADREDIPLFYVDLVAANSSLSDDPEKQELALELINVMTDSKLMSSIIGGTGEEDCQYILPAKKSCYTDLAERYPIYSQLQNVTGKSGNHIFRMGAAAHDYVKEAKKVLPHYLVQK